MPIICDVFVFSLASFFDEMFVLRYIINICRSMFALSTFPHLKLMLY